MPFMPNVGDIISENVDPLWPHINLVDEDDNVSVTSNPPTKRIRRSSTISNSQPTPESSTSSLELGKSDEHQANSDKDQSECITEKRRTSSKHPTRYLSHVYIPGPSFPLSAFHGSTSRRISNEFTAISELKEAFERHQSHAQSDYRFFQLDDFTIYRPPETKHAGEMASLDKLLNNGFPLLLVDGILSVGDARHSVKGVPFKVLTIDGYLDLNDVDVKEKICIQSIQGAYHDVWYQLGRPSKTYKRFYDPFIWLAQFTKHFVNYLSEHDTVVLGHFQHQFFTWLSIRYIDSRVTTSEEVLLWLSQVAFRDFRTTVNANLSFLYKECYGLDGNSDQLTHHPLWEEIDPQRLGAIPVQRAVERKTIVTPFVHECFSNMYFADQLESRTIESPVLRDAVAARKAKMRLTSHPSIKRQTATTLTSSSVSQPLQIKVGDVVSIQPGGEGWEKSTSILWHAYVQRLWTHKVSNETRMDVIWLYHPADTTIGNAKYPFHNELFFSDNCGCGQDSLGLEDIVGKVDISWFARDPYAQNGLFVRRKFRTVAEDDMFDFTDLDSNDFRCKCDQETTIYDEVREVHRCGDTILYKEKWKECLAVGQITRFESEHLRVRRLMRKNVTDPKARPNELLLTDSEVSISPKACIRRCHVRLFEPGVLPIPYDRNGAGDFFFIVQTATEPNSSPARKFPTISQGWDPLEPLPKRKLKGMGLFCGGGTFDRGLEEGGGIKFRYAIDYAERALHSYKANAQHKVHYFLGSVDDYIAQAIAGRADDKIAQPGDIDILAAGSPCQGFSHLQINKNSDDSKRNASRIASVVSFMDFYSPAYLVLENVVALTREIKPHGENVFSQLIAALAALGYQVQQFLMDSWLYASPQRRSRVFIVASAPGLKPLDPPAISHAHPQNWKFRSAKLGVSSSGLPFGIRHSHFTPFRHVSAGQAVEDLPNIEDGQVQLCPQFPDHRVPTEESAASRSRIAMVPILPRGLGLIQAWNKGLLRGEPLEWCTRMNKIRQAPGSKVYRRVDPDVLFPTIVTKLTPLDGKNGAVLHWDQHRVVTVQELRRAQGFLDHEVIVGTPTQQVEIIGNSVERNTALVLGVRFKDSWISPSKEDEARESYSSLQATDGNLNHRLKERNDVLLKESAAGFMGMMK